MKSNTDIYMDFKNTFPNPTHSDVKQQSLRMQMLGSLAYTGSTLLSEKQAKKIYGGARIDRYKRLGLITPRKDNSSRNGQYKYIKADIDTTLFNDYGVSLSELSSLTK